MSPRIHAAALAVLASLAAACRDNPASPALEAGETRASVTPAEGGGRILEPEVFPAFDLELTASGSMQPGTPIRLHLKGQANLPVSSAQISIVAPDFEAAKMSGFGPEYTLPAKGTRIPRLLERRASMAAGQKVSDAVTLTVPAPGYYRVVAAIETEADLPVNVGDKRVVRNTYREIWLRVDRRGGRATKKWERGALPDVAAQRPGPLHCRVSDVEERKGKPRDPACDGATVMMVEPIVCPMRTGEVQLMAVSSTCNDPCFTDPYLCGGDPCLIDPYSCYTPPPPPPPLQPLPAPAYMPCGAGPFQAEYFNGVTPGLYPVIGRCESSPVRHDWESRSPAPEIATDNFSARWTAWQYFAAGTYTFTARATDGVRVWVDDELLIDAWRDQGETNFRATRELAGGTHRVKMEYYDRTGDASAQLSWSGGPYNASDACFNNTTRCFQYWYYNPNTKLYETAPEGTLVKASYQDRDCAIACWWNEMYAVYHNADAEGRVKLACPANSSSKRLRTHHEFLDEFVAVGFDEWLGPEVHGCDTGWDRVEIATNEEAFVYGNMRKAGQRAVELMGHPSARVRVDFDSWPETTSWYNSPGHHISILDSDIWGTQGAATQAHEYGHSYHNKALGGIGHIYISGVPTHSFNSSDTGDKAYLEGFASFFGTLVMPGKGGTGWYVRHPDRWTQDQGSSLPVGVRTEGRAAAWFWDLIDDGAELGSQHEVWRNEPGVAAPYYWGSYAGAPAETWDGVQLTPTTVAVLIRSCRKLNGDRPESVDYLHYCLKNMLSTTLTPSLDAVWNQNINTPMP